MIVVCDVLVPADLFVAFTVFDVAFDFDARSVFDLLLLLMFLSPMLSILWLAFSIFLLHLHLLIMFLLLFIFILLFLFLPFLMLPTIFIAAVDYFLFFVSLFFADFVYFAASVIAAIFFYGLYCSYCHFSL